MIKLRDVADAMDQAGTDVAGNVGPIARLARLVTAHCRELLLQQRLANPPPNQLRRRRKAVFKHHEPTDSMLVSCDRGHLDLVDSMVEQLRKPAARQLRLQCTLVRMSEAIANEHGLLVGRALPANQVRAGKVLKAAVTAQGTLLNLPEVLAVPLVPFRIERAAAGRTSGSDKSDDKKPAGTPTAKPVRLRGEAALLKDDQAIFAVQLATELPKDPTLLPTNPLLSCTMPLVAGSGVLVRVRVIKDAPKNEAVVVVWFRFAEVVPPKQPTPKPESGK